MVASAMALAAVAEPFCPKVIQVRLERNPRSLLRNRDPAIIDRLCEVLFNFTQLRMG